MEKDHWQASSYNEHAAFVSAMATEVMALLAPENGETILDLGCGDGELGEYIAAQGCHVTCVDASASMVEAALARGLTAVQMDGNKIDFNDQFDAVFSNAALHWMLEPEQVIGGVHKALKKKGRFVTDMGGAGNIAALLKVMSAVFKENPSLGVFKNPWYFPNVDTYKALLEKGGFSVESIELIPRPTPLESGLLKWLEIFADSITTQLAEEQKADFFAEVKEKLVAELYSEQEGWVADYVRLRFKVIKQ